MKLDKRGKIRLDVMLTEQQLAPSRERARKLIMTGNVLVDNSPVDKPGTLISRDAEIHVKKTDHPYVSRGGLKLEKALNELPVETAGRTCLDVGASTGGFTDCLLRKGAARVYAVDVGYGQFDWRLREDPRTRVIERTNIRYMPYDRIGAPMDLIVADTSFISLRTVIPSVEKFMRKGTDVIALIKPQFEAGKGKVGKGGVIRDEAQRQKIVEDLAAFFRNRGYTVGAVLVSPIRGPKGNKEYIIHLKYF